MTTTAATTTTDIQRAIEVLGCFGHLQHFLGNRFFGGYE
jgi:hypothetical protein